MWINYPNERTINFVFNVIRRVELIKNTCSFRPLQNVCGVRNKNKIHSVGKCISG